ncbi:MAG TPA: Spy/CpxP family protein refolding chaperone [Caulobacteraceae bacterium]|nr:Spy/CpxP family protein refolding chaperone [Caulobacteraceae bacterium]
MVSGAVGQTSQGTAAEKLARLHDSLNLKAGQEQAWHSYTAVIQAGSQATARHNATQTLLPQLKTPRRIALIEATMAQDVSDLRRQGEAVVAFYNQLTPDQQAIFDKETQQLNTQQ